MFEINYFICFEVDPECKALEDLDWSIKHEYNNKVYVSISRNRMNRPSTGITDDLWKTIDKHLQFKDCPVVELELCSHSYGGPLGNECVTDFRVVRVFERGTV